MWAIRRELGAGLFVLLAAATARSAAAPPLAPSPEQFVGARQAAFDLSVFAEGSMRRAVETNQPVSSQAYAAASLGKWARVLPALFPPGTGPGQVRARTQARAEIWTDRKGFERAAADYAEAAQALADRAKADDGPGFKDALARVSETCSLCHATYKDGPK